MTIAARIQHHPSRRHLLPELCRALAPLPVEVVAHTSDPPSPWAGYLCCLTDIPDCSHLLIVQDDAVPCGNFPAALERVAQAQPDTPVLLFVSKLPADLRRRLDGGMRMGRRYVDVPWRSFMPVVAVLWPRAKALEFAAWAAEHPALPGQREPRSDDAMAGMWKIRTRQHVVAAVPSLVDHRGDVPSVKDHYDERRQPPSATWRAVHMAGDGLDYDW